MAAISEEMERRVLEASYAIRDGLEEAEQAVAAVRGELDVDERLVQGDMAYVEVMHCYERSVAGQCGSHRKPPLCAARYTREKEQEAVRAL